MRALPSPSGADVEADADMGELRHELEQVAIEALDARMRGIDLASAVNDPRFELLSGFHRDLRDALLMEIPGELQPWVRSVAESDPAAQSASPLDTTLHADLFAHAQGADPSQAGDGPAQLQAALAELLLFESVRLHLLVAAWSSTEFEALGGDEQDLDAIAWTEVEAMLQEPALSEGDVRPMPVMLAAGNIALARDAADRAEALRLVGEEQRETLRMRARLRAALRELRLPESVLLENALSGLLGEERFELPELQARHPVALDGLSRQAMDQRVSRGRRALGLPPDEWPSRRKPALFDLLRGASESD
ncbi:hypothetical protein ACNOYE_31265 [Nannocystaceae bacterium ST9]